MSTIVLCLLVGSNNIVLKIQSVVIMHKENKYVSIIRDIRDNRYLTLFIVSGKKTCLIQDSYASRVIAYFVFKFRYHGNKGRSGVNLNDTIK